MKPSQIRTLSTDELQALRRHVAEELANRWQRTRQPVEPTASAPASATHGNEDETAAFEAALSRELAAYNQRHGHG